MLFGLVSFLVLIALLGTGRSLSAFVVSSFLTIALVIFLGVKAAAYSKEDYGATGSDFGGGSEKPRKNLAKHQPDTLDPSDKDILKIIAKVQKRKPRP
jgi:hypothetical protein